jgi:hypothetical protein
MFDKLKGRFKREETPVETEQRSMLEGFTDVGGSPSAEGSSTMEEIGTVESASDEKTKRVDQLSRQRQNTQRILEQAASLQQKKETLEASQTIAEKERQNRILEQAVKRIKQYPAVSEENLVSAFRAEMARAHKRAMGGTASESDKYELKSIRDESDIYGVDEELLMRITNLRRRMEGRTVGSAVGRGVRAGSELAKRVPAVGGSMMRYAGNTARPIYDEGLLQRGQSYGAPQRTIGPAGILSPNKAFGMFATPRINIPRQGERQTYMPGSGRLMDQGGSSGFADMSTGRTQQFSNREMTSTDAVSGIFGSGRRGKYNHRAMNNPNVLRDIFG